MIDNGAFMAAICEDPFDDGRRKVYSDWLEERGKPQAELIRLMVECRKLRSCPTCLGRGQIAICPPPGADEESQQQTITKACDCGLPAKAARVRELIANVKRWWNADIDLQVNQFGSIGFDRGLLGSMQIGTAADIDLPESAGVFTTHPIVAIAVATAEPDVVFDGGSSAPAIRGWRWYSIPLSGAGDTRRPDGSSPAARLPPAIWAPLASSAGAVDRWSEALGPALRNCATLIHTSQAAAVYHLSAVLVQRGRERDGLPALPWHRLMQAAHELLDVPDASTDYPAAAGRSRRLRVGGQQPMVGEVRFEVES